MATIRDGDKKIFLVVDAQIGDREICVRNKQS